MTFRDRFPAFKIQSREALQRWGRQTLFLIGGLLVGAAAILMAALADYAQRDFHRLLGLSPISSLVLTPLGFGAIVFMTLESSRIRKAAAFRR